MSTDAISPPLNSQHDAPVSLGPTVSTHPAAPEQAPTPVRMSHAHPTGSRSNSSDNQNKDSHHHLSHSSSHPSSSSPVDEKAAFTASSADPASGQGQQHGKDVLSRSQGNDHGHGHGHGNGQRDPNGPKLYSHGLFDKELAPIRKQVLKALIGTLVILTLVMWASVTAYWGSLWHSNHYTNHLKFLIINNDVSSSITPTALSPLLGSYLTNTLLSNANGSLTGGSTIGTLGYELYKESAGSLSHEDIVHMVHDQQIWGAIVIATDATAQIQSARQVGNASFAPSTMVEFYYEQARNEQAASYYVNINSGVVSAALARWSALSAASYLSANADNATAIGLLATAPQTIAPAAGWTSNNLRPYNQPVAAALTLVGGIYSIIFTFIITMAWNGVRGMLAPYLTTRSLILARVFVPLTLYIPVSLVYSMVNLPFKVLFDSHFSSYAGGYFVFWLYVYMSMAANGLATEFFITVLTMRFVSFALLPLILVQVCVVALPKELQPRIFHYGPAAPLQRLGHAVRTIIFDTKNTLGEDAGIIIAWLVCSMITISIATLLYRRKEIKQAERASADKLSSA